MAHVLQQQSLKSIVDTLKQSAHERVKVALSDIDGVLRGKYLSKEKFLSVLEGGGFGFCDVVLGWDCADVVYDNADFTGWHTGYPDARAVIDHTTFRTIPWENEVPFFLAQFVESSGSAHPLCPRQLLQRVLKRVSDAGFSVVSAFEFEWFNFKETPQSVHQKGFQNLEPLSPGMFGYSLLRSTLNQPFFEAIMTELPRFGVPIEGLHTETGPGVLEAAIACAPALESADRAILFKTAAKEIGYRFGILPTFMAKWNEKLPGCSGHCHQSLWNDSGDKNLFHDESRPHRISQLFESYLAGQLRCLPELLPLLAPTVNSYKRLVDGYWAPTKPSWGVDNRTVACRVIPGSSKSTRLETRVPGADINPYLALAACVGAGLYGIERRMTLSDSPVKGSSYQESSVPRFARTLHEATQRFAESEAAHEILGAAFVSHFAKTRAWEWRQYQDTVSHWELSRYLEII